MSRAFVRESDGDDPGDVPERPISPHPNYVRPRGLALLKAEAARLADEQGALKAAGESLDAHARLAAVARDLRYVNARIASAIVVGAAVGTTDEVRFGARVKVADEDGVVRAFTLVGEDEADAAANLVSWVAPLARAVLGAGVGDDVILHRPAGDTPLTVVGIEAVEDGGDIG
jgi:transcription elongation GreA/GreB family factor